MREGHPQLAVCLCRKSTPKCSSMKHHLRLISRCLRFRSGEQLSCVGLAGGGHSGGVVRCGRRTPRGRLPRLLAEGVGPLPRGPQGCLWVPHHVVPARQGRVTQLGEALPSPPPTLLLSSRSHVQVTLKGRDVAASFLRSDFKASARGHFGQQR